MSITKTHKVIIMPAENSNENQLGLYRKGDKNFRYNLTGAESRRLKYNGYSPYHLYILSDDEIKIGDWFYDDDGELCQYTSDYKVTPNEYGDNKKIIATTDILPYACDCGRDELEPHRRHDCRSRYSISKIPESFIKDYIKAYSAGNPIEEVELEYLRGSDGHYDENNKWHWKILGLKLTENNEVMICLKEEKMYSREEVIEKIYSFNRDKPGNFDCTKWIEENL